MKRKFLTVTLTIVLSIGWVTGTGLARGFGGGGRGGFGGGARGGFGGSGGFRSGYGGGVGDFRGGFGGAGSLGQAGFRGGLNGYGGEFGGARYGGMPEFSRTPSFSSPRTIDVRGRGAAGNLPARAGGDARQNLMPNRTARQPVGPRPADGGRADRPNIAPGRDDNVRRSYPFDRYAGYHAGWVHGYWNGHNDAAWGWRHPYWAGWGWGLGAGLGWGLASWGYGSALYGMGYLPYSDPYYVSGPVAGGQPVYDYSQPINTVAAAPEAAVAYPAMGSFDSARQAFKQGNYADALEQTNLALKTLPNDATLHEFRALCLFALMRYDEAAAPLYAVLSVGPGWDWTTLISLYPDADTYTIQLRALEQYCVANPSSASSRFVLAYQYLSQGNTSAAVGVLKQVVALQPNDALSAKLLRQLDPSQDKPETVATSTATDTAPPAGASIQGTWTAQPAADTSINLTIAQDGKFDWKVTMKGQPQQFQGSSTYGNGILTLAQDAGPALVGRVSWNDPNHMTFRVAGEGPQDPGLAFSK